MSDSNAVVYQGGDWGHIVSVDAVLSDNCKYLMSRSSYSSAFMWSTNTGISMSKPSTLTCLRKFLRLPLSCVFIDSRLSFPASYRVPSLLTHPLLFLELLTVPINTPLRTRLQSTLAFRKREFGYFQMQATKPQTLGYSHADSPVGLLAWNYEKLFKAVDGYDWTDDEGALLCLSASPPWMRLTCAAVSTRVDIDLLVLACRPRCGRAHLLRDDTREHGGCIRRDQVDVCPRRRLVLPQGAGQAA